MSQPAVPAPNNTVGSVHQPRPIGAKVLKPNTTMAKPKAQPKKRGK